jgi:3-hydroxyisobutyrate dehydrogenase-like beta-hydroxyacid dehydrogenase
MANKIEKVGFLGLGIMGAPMAANLARAGFEVHAWNRTRAKAEALAAEHAGVVVAETPAAAAAATGVVITMVPDVPEVKAVLLGPDGAAEGLATGGLAIDMSTIGPTAVREIGGVLADRGIGFLDAPVTGSRPKAEDGTLTIMVGGDAEQFERAGPLFEAMGSQALHVGPLGDGAMMKLINNTLAAANSAALAEGLTIARKAGLDTDKLLTIVGSGSGSSAALELKARPMLEGDFDPLFKLVHMHKDVDRLLQEAAAIGAFPALSAAVEEAYSDAIEAGLGEQDFAAVIEPIATKFGLK